MPPFTVLHVCMGNICRSPMAERLTVAAVRALAGDKADELVLIHSTGTGGWHAGSRMDPSAARQVLARGGEADTFRARQLTTAHVEASDLVLTATTEQWEFVTGLAADAAARTFVLGQFGRLLRRIDPAALPPAAPTADAVYARGVALVSAVAEARGDRPPHLGDDLDDPWGRSDAYFGRVADEVDGTVRPLAALLLGA
ncbi:phosphotyrosine protein phosphatase [Planosporangium sp. 12N6]|uniref:arsenate reductase/protein-tyrosine-phosphatase family protein n=1 Tax=Planosporangium spinosum TaxID=3402278 RepID=UPI003CF28F9A